MQERSDEDLMVAVLEGDQAALGVLVDRHHAPLFGYLYRLVAGDRPLAEDLVQETLLRLLRRRTYQRGRPFKPWLYTIATNLTRDHFKAAPTRHGVRAPNEEALRNLRDPDPSPEEHAVAAEQKEEVRVAVAQLSEEYRLVVLLRFYQGFKLQEIAETLQIPVGTVKSRLSVGVDRLRSTLARSQTGVD